jgi:hypothetical protein
MINLFLQVNFPGSISIHETLAARDLPAINLY